MQIQLPSWKPEYKPHMTKQAYSQILSEAQALLVRALEVYQGYLKTGDAVLYEVFDEVMVKLKPKCKLLKWAAWLELQRLSERLLNAAHACADDKLPYRATMLYDLAGVMRG